MLTPKAQQMRGEAQQILRENAGLIYRHTATWAFAGVTAPHATRFSVKDPRLTDYGSAQAAQGQAARLGVPFADLRLVKVHPDDARPRKGSTLAWDGGTLTLLEWSQTSDLTGQALGLAVVRR